MNATTATERVQYIDMARFFGIALVYYGHLIERFMLLRNPAGFVHYKFIYSFHMVLFFILAGFVAKERNIELGFGRYLKHRVFSRIVPFLFFTAIFMIPPLFFSGDFVGLTLPSTQGYIHGLIMTAFGIPVFCVPSWFILMLFSVELVHYGVFRFIRSSDALIMVTAMAFYVVGYWVNLKMDLFNPAKGRVVGWNYLFIHEAVTMYGFYLFGLWLHRKRFLIEAMPSALLVTGMVISGLIVFFTYALNTGPFNFDYYKAVVIMFASHGSFFWFPITAVAGSFCVLFLARLTPGWKTILWMGRSTLILMCLNGVFYHYVNPKVSAWFLTHASGSFLAVLGAGSLTTAASLALCIPLIYLFDTYVPQLVGKPKTVGPWMKNFI